MGTRRGGATMGADDGFDFDRAEEIPCGQPRVDRIPRTSVGFIQCSQK
jgi:hypothetical protein